MYNPNVDYYQPTTVQEAIKYLSKHKGAKILAGGHSLLPAMKLRLAAPSALVDIGRVKELAGITASATSLKIGALTTHATIAASAEVKAACPILAEAAAQIGDLQVRNRGTIGGSLAHADPGADLPTVILALGATLAAMGPKGEREIAADKFFTDMLTTALKKDEVLTAITVPVLRAGTGSAYLKHRHQASGYAVAGVAALVEVKGGQVASATLAVGGVTANPVRASAAEKALIGQKADEAAVASASAKVPNAITDPVGDSYASEEYRVHLATVLARRALTQAIQRATK